MSLFQFCLFIYFVLQIPHVNALIYYVSFSDWLIRLSIISSRPILIVTSGKVLFFVFLFMFSFVFLVWRARSEKILLREIYPLVRVVLSPTSLHCLSKILLPQDPFFARSSHLPEILFLQVLWLKQKFFPFSIFSHVACKSLSSKDYFARCHIPRAQHKPDT